MKNYIIPYGERFTMVGESGISKRTLMSVDGIGLIVKYWGKKPTKKEVRKYLIGWNQQNEIIIQANSLLEALKKFYDFPEAKVGITDHAWEIASSESNPIREYASCSHMKVEDYIKCGIYDEPGETSNMICILDGLDEPPEDCPINNQLEKWRSETTLVELDQYLPVWIRRYYDPKEDNMEKIFKRAQDIGKNTKATIERRIVKMNEELGEFCEAHLESVDFKENDKSKEELREHLLEEGCDVFLMSLDLLIKAGFDLKEIIPMAQKKLDKWESQINKKL